MKFSVRKEQNFPTGLAMVKTAWSYHY